MKLIVWKFSISSILIQTIMMFSQYLMDICAVHNAEYNVNWRLEPTSKLNTWVKNNKYSKYTVNN